MRISDWSSDVCSSDLPQFHAAASRRTLPVADGSYMCRATPDNRLQDPGRARRARRRVRLDRVRGVPEIREAGRSPNPRVRSEEHTSELQSLMRRSYAVFCLKKKK